MHYAHSPLFEKIYSLYSMLDILQVIDPQGLNKKKKKAPLFSERFLPRHEKIEQVAIKFNDRSLMHIEFVKLDFVSNFRIFYAILIIGKIAVNSAAVIGPSVINASALI